MKLLLLLLLVLPTFCHLKPVTTRRVEIEVLPKRAVVSVTIELGTKDEDKDESCDGEFTKIIHNIFGFVKWSY